MMVKQDVVTEKTIQKAIERVLKSYGKKLWYRKIHGNAFHSGIPDIIGTYCGYFFAIEIKGPTGRIRETQKVSHGLIKEAGGISIITDDPGYIADMLGLMTIDFASASKRLQGAGTKVNHFQDICSVVLKGKDRCDLLQLKDELQ